jgi:hypothetical protein
MANAGETRRRYFSVRGIEGKELAWIDEDLVFHCPEPGRVKAVLDELLWAAPGGVGPGVEVRPLVTEIIGVLIVEKRAGASTELQR